MKNTFKHLLFFDDRCSLCQKSVQFLRKIDKKKRFDFVPIGTKVFSTTFSSKAKYYERQNSLILVENYATKTKKIWIRSKAFFRIFWLLQGKWAWLGWMYIFPSFFLDWIYRFIAKHRHKLIK